MCTFLLRQHYKVSKTPITEIEESCLSVAEEKDCVLISLRRPAQYVLEIIMPFVWRVTLTDFHLCHQNKIQQYSTIIFC